jgi:tight adherence protein B
MKTIKIFEKFNENKKRKLFESQLPEALDTVANSLRAGLTFLQAINYMAEETSPPISNEFKEVIKEIQLGATIEDALKKLSEKIKSTDLDIFITACLVTRETGGNLAEIVTKISSTIRERQILQNQIKSLTAQGRLSGIVVGVLPFLLAIGFTLIDPELMKPMFTTPLGIGLLALAIVMECIGAFIIKKIITIDI